MKMLRDETSNALIKARDNIFRATEQAQAIITSVSEGDTITASIYGDAAEIMEMIVHIFAHVLSGLDAESRREMGETFCDAINDEMERIENQKLQ